MPDKRDKEIDAAIAEIDRLDSEIGEAIELVDVELACIDAFLKDGIQTTRNETIEMCISLCEAIAKQGGCATCCVDQLTLVLNELTMVNMQERGGHA